MNQDTEYIKIDLTKVLNGLLRRAWIIILCMLLCGALLVALALLPLVGIPAFALMIGFSLLFFGLAFALRSYLLSGGAKRFAAL